MSAISTDLTLLKFLIIEILVRIPNVIRMPINVVFIVVNLPLKTVDFDYFLGSFGLKKQLVSTNPVRPEQGVLW